LLTTSGHYQRAIPHYGHAGVIGRFPTTTAVVWARTDGEKRLQPSHGGVVVVLIGPNERSGTNSVIDGATGTLISGTRDA